MDRYIKDCDNNICNNIAHARCDDRGFISQNILSQLRNLLDHICVKIYVSDKGIAAKGKEYETIQTAKSYVKSVGKLAFLAKFHELLLISTSHYTFDAENSERLMLKYYEYLLRTKTLMQDKYGMEILHNLDEFPLDTDPALDGYYRAIAEMIDLPNLVSAHTTEHRYRIEKIKPFFVEHRIYYEVTFSPANDKASKFDRIIAFTNRELPQHYAIYLRLTETFISVDGMSMPINIIVDSKVAIRPCELRNFSRIFGISINVAKTNEYSNLMGILDDTGMSLTEIMDLPDDDFRQILSEINRGARSFQLTGLLKNAGNLSEIMRSGQMSSGIFC